MDSKIAGMIGAAALAAVGSTPVAAAPDPDALLQAASFAELLQPIANASVQLAMIDTLGTPASSPWQGEQGREMMAQYHHHHHHGWWRRHRRWHHHHHHHHHHHW